MKTLICKKNFGSTDLVSGKRIVFFAAERSSDVGTQGSALETKAETPEQKKDVKKALDEAKKEALVYAKKAEDAKEAIKKSYKIDSKDVSQQAKEAKKATSEVIAGKLPEPLREPFKTLDALTTQLRSLQGNIDQQEAELARSLQALNQTLSTIDQYQNPEGDPLLGLKSGVFDRVERVAKVAKPNSEKVKAEPMTPERMRELALTALDKFGRAKAQELTNEERSALIDIARRSEVKNVITGIVEGKPVTFVLSPDGRFGRISVSKDLRNDGTPGSLTKETLSTTVRPLKEGDTQGIEKATFALLPEEVLREKQKENLDSLAKDLKRLESLPNGSSVILAEHKETRRNPKTGATEEFNVSTVIEKNIKDGALQVHELVQKVNTSPDGKRIAVGEATESRNRPYNKEDIAKLVVDGDYSSATIEATKETQADLVKKEFKEQSKILAGQLVLGAGTTSYNTSLDNLVSFLKKNTAVLSSSDQLSYEYDEFGGIKIAYNVQKNELEISRGKQQPGAPSSTPDSKQQYASRQIINLSNPERRG